MNKYFPLEKFIQSVSKTHKFDKDRLVFLNTSDVLEGKILINHYTNVSDLKGQAKKTIKNGDILYSEIRPKNKRYAYVKGLNKPEDYVVSTKLMVLRNHSDDLNTDYLYHFLTYSKTIEYLQSRAENRIGSFPQITFDVLKSIKIWLPDISTQQKIASILSSLDAKIDLNNRINAELEAMAKTLYDYWFVQFDFPISKEQAQSMGKPKLAGKPYKSSGGKMVYHPQLKREIPEGWEVRKLGEWVKKDKNGDWGKENEEGNYTENVICIRGADLNAINGQGQLKAPERYILQKNKNKILEANDIIVEISGGSPTQSTGRISLITEDTMNRFKLPLICSNFCKAVTLKDERQVFYFNFLWNSIYDNNILFGWEGKTSGIKNLLFDSFLKSYNAVLPNNIIINKFNQFVIPIHQKIQKNLLENQQLTELRDWLLPMLMNGQVKVGDVEETNLNMAAEPEGEYGG